MLIFSLLEAEKPVVSISISIIPVVGSVAAYLVATLISLTASLTSSFVTVSYNFILAKASDNLIMDSNYLGVDEMTFLDNPNCLMD